MTVITMSRSEIDRMSVLRDLAEDRIRVSEAARLMGLGRRQVLRLAKAYRQRGPAALVSNRRGNRSNRSYPKRVMVVDYPDGRLAIRHNGVDLPYRPFDKRQRVNQAAIVENKRLGPVLAYIAKKQKEQSLPIRFVAKALRLVPAGSDRAARCYVLSL